MDPLTALAAFAPLVVDLGKGLIARFVSPDVFKPGTVEEWLRMRESDVTLFKAMNEAGAQPSYPWVGAIISLMRPAVCLIVLGVWSIQALSPGGATDAVSNFASAVGFYLFGDRTLFHLRNSTAASSGVTSGKR